MKKATLGIVLLATLWSSGKVWAGSLEMRFERLWPVLQQPWYFAGPELTSDRDGFYYLLDLFAGRVLKLNTQGQFVNQWGRSGSAPGQLLFPTGVAVDSLGFVYVADAGQNAISKFDANGVFITRWGVAGSGPGELSAPYRLAFDLLDSLYVTELLNDRVSVFSAPAGDDPSAPHDFDFSFGESGNGPGQMREPQGIAVDESGNIFVASAINNRVQKFSPGGVLLSEWGEASTNSAVLVPGRFSLASAVAINRQDEVLVGDFSRWIQVFDNDGNYLREIGGSLSGDDIASINLDIEVLANGELLVQDSRTVRRLSADGEALARFGGRGSAPGSFSFVTDAEALAGDQYAVADFSSEQNLGRLQVFDLDSTVLDVQNLSPHPRYLASRSDGRLYGASFNSGSELAIFDPPTGGQLTDGLTLTNQFGERGLGCPEVLLGNAGPDQLLTAEFCNLGDAVVSNPGGGVFNTQALAAGDLNGDGIEDLIIATNGPNQRVLVNFPDPDGPPQPVSADADDSRAVRLLEVDANSTLDLVVANAGAPDRVFVNDGSGNFTPAGTLGSGPDTTLALAVADVDNNDSQDVFTGLAGGQSRIWLNNGGSFTPGPAIGGPTETIAAAAFADFDGDGDPDLLIGRNGTNQIYFNTAGSFANPVDVTSDAHDTRSVSVGNINSDTQFDPQGLTLSDTAIDIVVGNFGQVNRYYLNDGSGQGFAGADIGSESENTTAIALTGDYANGQTREVLVANNGQANRLYGFLNNGDATQQTDYFGRMTVLPDGGSADQATNALTQITRAPYQPGQFVRITGLDFSSGDFLYALDKDFNHIVRMDPDGNPLAVSPIAEDLSLNPMDLSAIAVDDQERVFVADLSNNRVLRLAPPASLAAGQPHTVDLSFSTLGSQGRDGVAPEGLDLRPDGSVVVSSLGSVRIYTADGSFITRVGGSGNGPGGIVIPDTVTSFSDGRLAVMDGQLSRNQIFTPVPLATNSKAIIVAGGGPYPGNALWDATQVNANFAYRVLLSQGFTRDQIQYLSHDTSIDIDSNGQADDVDALATRENIEAAFTNFAPGAESLLVYFVDHGGLDQFRLNATQTLAAGEVGSWLDGFQSGAAGSALTMVYDACQSGSFLDETRSEEFDRVVVTSAQADQNAYFVSQGTLSFSNQFWTHVFNGLSVENAFTLASQSQNTSFPLQQPLLEADGDGQTNTAADLQLVSNRFIGAGTTIAGDSPVVGSVDVSPPVISTATLSASSVTDADGIGRVWVVLRPPGFLPGSPDNPVQDLPTIDLTRSPGSDNYSAPFSGFVSPGAYQLTFYAQDRLGNTAVPQVRTINIDNPFRRKAIIVAAGGPATSPDTVAGIANSAALAYAALVEQGYGPDGVTCDDPLCDDIQYLSNLGVSGFDAAPTLSNLEFAITQWAVQDGQDLAVFLVGVPATDGLAINSTEVLTGSALDGWLDTAQASLSGPVVVVYDGEQSGSFLPELLPPTGSQRIVAVSDGDLQSCNFVLQPDQSFSRFFWTQVLNGATVRQAFNLSRSAVRQSDRSQQPLLDDNGNGLGNEFTDGLFARGYAIGSGVLLAGDEPLIGSVTPPQTITGAQSIELFAQDVTSTGQVLSVDALVTMPNCTQRRISLPLEGDQRFAQVSNLFAEFTGTYDVAFVAVDDEGISSLPAVTRVVQLDGGSLFKDGFE